MFPGEETIEAEKAAFSAVVGSATVSKLKLPPTSNSFD